MTKQTPYRQRIAQALANGRPVLASNECQYLCLQLADPSQALALPSVVPARDSAFYPIWLAQDAKAFAENGLALPDLAKAVCDAHWPGPLVLRFKDKSDSPRQVQVPSDTFLREVIAAVEEVRGKPTLLRATALSLPSGLPCTQLSHVFEALDLDNAEAALRHFAYVIDGGLTKHGISATLLECSGDEVHELVPGPIDVTKLTEALGPGFRAATDNPSSTPGSGHLAPRVLLLGAGEMLTLEPVGLARVLTVQTQRKRSDRENWRYLPAEPAAYARHLLDAVQEAISHGMSTLYIDTEPQHAAVRAALWRLRQLGASSPSVSASA